MKVDKKQAERIISTAKNIADMWKRYEKIKAVWYGDISITRKNKLRNDVNYLMEALEKESHELHCRSVEAGIAMREPDRYGTVLMSPDPWHTHKVIFREPVSGSIIYER